MTRRPTRTTAQVTRRTSRRSDEGITSTASRRRRSRRPSRGSKHRSLHRPARGAAAGPRRSNIRRSIATTGGRSRRRHRTSATRTRRRRRLGPSQRRPRARPRTSPRARSQPTPLDARRHPRMVSRVSQPQHSPHETSTPRTPQSESCNSFHHTTSALPRARARVRAWQHRPRTLVKLVAWAGRRRRS